MQVGVYEEEYTKLTICELKEKTMTNREQTTIRLPAELKEKLEQEAHKKGMTTKGLIIFILFDYFENTIQE